MKGNVKRKTCPRPEAIVILDIEPSHAHGNACVSLASSILNIARAELVLQRLSSGLVFDSPRTFRSSTAPPCGFAASDYITTWRAYFHITLASYLVEGVPRLHMPLFGGPSEPIGCLGLVLCHSVSKIAHNTEEVLSVSIPLLGSTPNPTC